MTVPFDMPSTAWAIIQAVASDYENLAPESLLPKNPQTNVLRAARRAAMARVCEERIDDRWRYEISDVMRWFTVSRTVIYRARCASPDFSPRSTRAHD